jgi:histidinol-phosphate aminotransferase
MERHPKHHNKNILRLDKNECICPTFIKKILYKAKISHKDYFTYSSSLDIELFLGSYFNCSDSSNNIYTDNGSEQVLKNLINVLNCDTWVIPTPTFEMFPVYCSLYKKSTKTISFLYNQNRFSLNISQHENQRAGLYLVTPHNPTGCILSQKEITNLSYKFKYLIVDQAYFSPLQKLDISKLPSNVIIVRTFSKMGGLTGMRFGFCISNNSDIIYQLNLLRPMYLNTLTIKLVDTILKSPNDLKIIPKEFNKVKSLLDLPIVAEAGNFVLLKDIPEFKGYKLKKYTFNDQDFFRMTLFDTTTYYNL